MANEYLDKTGLTHFWDNIKGEIGNASDAQVDDWLDRHPEATTTVQDGSIESVKLKNDLLHAVSSGNMYSNGLYAKGLLLPYIAVQGGNFNTDPASKHVCLPVDNIHKVRLVADSNATVYAFLTSDICQAGGSIPFCQGITERTVLNANVDTGEISLPDDCKFLYLHYVASGSDTILLPKEVYLDGYNVRGLITEYIDEKINESYEKTLEYINGVNLDDIKQKYIINSNGTYSSSPSSHACIEINGSQTVRIVQGENAGAYTFLTDNNCYDGMSAPFCQGITQRTTINGNYDTGDLTSPADCKYLYVAYKNNAGVNISPKEIYINGRNILNNIVNEHLSNVIAIINAKTNWISNIIAMNTNQNIIHFSIDDVTEPLQDLIDNPSYESVWESPHLSMLKTAHETCGLSITLNCFTNYNGVDITTLPSNPTWQSELQAATWLKFAFHARSDAHYYSQSQLNDYNDFVTGIMRLTNSYNCIDKITRLGYFEGSYSAIMELKNATPSIIGFLTADSSGRLSYYLNSSKAAFVWKHGMMLDVDNEIIFIKTLPRLDNNSYQDAIDDINNSLPMSSNIIEIFGHGVTSTLVDKFVAVAQWANNNGFINAFPSELYSTE